MTLSTVTSTPSVSAASTGVVDLSVAGDLARSVLVTEALQGKVGATLADAMGKGSENMDSATELELQFGTTALDVWTAFASAAIAKHKETVKDVAQKI